MVWIKRNLLLILFILGTLAMTGLAVFSLLNRIAADKKATEDLKKASSELGQLVQSKPAPTDSNIQAAKDEAQKLGDLSAQVKPLLTVQPEVPMENIEFKSMLETTVAELTAEADTLGIELPARYSFTFTAQRAMVDFPSNSIVPLTSQLKEVKEICRVLFGAKVHSLDALKRVRAYAAEAAGSGEYLDTKIVVTNKMGAVITPYQIAFKGFSSELTAVLEGFQKSDIFFVVKTVQVNALNKGVGTMANPGMGMDGGRSILSGGSEPPAGSIPGSTPAGRTTQPGSAPGGSTPAGGNAAAGANAQDAALKTVLDETPKRFIMNLEVVKTFAK